MSGQRLRVFNLVSLDGYVAGEGGDISWHNAGDPEFQQFAERASGSGSTLLFGRVTYQLMAGYWPTPEARRSDPIVAQGMNDSPKVVFSRTLKKADWSNTRLVKDDLLGEVRKLKRQDGEGLTVLGSAGLVAQLAQARLIDEYQMLVNPVALGKGKTMFEGLKDRLRLKLTGARAYGQNVLLSYADARRSGR